MAVNVFLSMIVMVRILLLIILVWLVYVVVKRLFLSFQPKQRSTESDSGAEKIVACSQCGLHIPESESKLVDGMIYCNNPECQHKKQ